MLPWSKQVKNPGFKACHRINDSDIDSFKVNDGQMLHDLFLIYPANASLLQDIDDQLLTFLPVNNADCEVRRIVIQGRSPEGDSHDRRTVIDRSVVADEVQVVTRDETDILTREIINQVLAGPQGKRLSTDDDQPIVMNHRFTDGR